MNEQTPDDQQPDSRPADGLANDPAPRHPDAPTEATAAAERDADAAPAAKRRGRGILRPILVGTGAAAVVLAVAGVGMAIADAVDDGDDDPVATQTADAAPGATPGATPDATPGATSGTGDDSDGGGDDSDGRGDDDRDDDRDDDDRDDDFSQPGAGASTEPADLAAALEAAVRAAGGGAATSVEVERDGWKVDVRLDDGSELDVRVPVSGEPIVRADDDDDDRSSDAPLDPARVADISAAAIAAAGGGVVTSIEAEDDAQVRFEVEVASDGDDVDVELADDLAVVAVNR